MWGEDAAGSEVQNDIGVARLKAAQWMNIIRMSNKLISKAKLTSLTGLWRLWRRALLIASIVRALWEAPMQVHHSLASLRQAM